MMYNNITTKEQDPQQTIMIEQLRSIANENTKKWIATHYNDDYYPYDETIEVKNYFSDVSTDISLRFMDHSASKKFTQLIS